MNQTPKEEKIEVPHFQEIESDIYDIQALITRGYRSLWASSYILLQIEDPGEAKEYFNRLADEYITTLGYIKNVSPGDDPDEAVQIAFTLTGLEKLEVGKDVLETFSREFLEGMSYWYHDSRGAIVEERGTLLGDVEISGPKNWHWGNKGRPVDCIVMLFAKNKKALGTLLERVFTKQKKGVERIDLIDPWEFGRNKLREHFGFMDGISQPVIKAIAKSPISVHAEKNLINTGEFILGYRNAYNNYSQSPFVAKDDGSREFAALPGSEIKDLGKNGTYLVFRQMEQHVERFWDFQYTSSREPGNPYEKAIILASKMVGRRPNGEPLVMPPAGQHRYNKDALNDFNYSEWDKDGLQCPLGAHIRRTNPRDQVHAGRDAQDSLEMSNAHRMIRRGRIYGPPLDPDFNIPNLIRLSTEAISKTGDAEERDADGKPLVKRGIHFICLVSDIARQFEFVQNVWANTPTFADLCNEVDPIISPRQIVGGCPCTEFTVPKEILRTRYTKVPSFTTIMGGAYFFMPGIRALRYLLKS